MCVSVCVCVFVCVYVSYESCYGSDTILRVTILCKSIYVIQASGTSAFVATK